MRKVLTKRSEWQVSTIDPPILTSMEWVFCNLLGLVFLVMGLLQLISFEDFRDALTAMGVEPSGTWAAAVIFAEFFAAAGLFKLRLSYLFRAFSGSLAMLASGFWFVTIAQAISGGLENLPNTGLFGRFLTQSPGWWTLIQATLLVLFSMYAVALTRYTIARPRRR